MSGDLEWGAEGRRIRSLILEAAFSAKKGHIGSALSVADIVLAIDVAAHGIGAPDSAGDLVMSKGHAAGALYALLAMRGRISQGDLLSYCTDGSVFGTHPSIEIPSVLFATGSLGQGVGFAVGLALAHKMRGRNKRVFCIMSDAEINEGAVWEAMLIAAHHRLANLSLVVDSNGQQALGYTSEILNTDGFGDAASSLGWYVVQVDGHRVSAIVDALERTSRDQPQLLLCRTVSGSGVPFMEKRIEWHYFPMSPDQYQDAQGDVSRWDNS